jgi:hypothetical protein
MIRMMNCEALNNARSASASALLRLLPPVLRAREFHLYLEGGRRITDLWQSGGRAVLGHKPPQVLRELKNAAERGLLAPFPHPAEQRFFKALSLILPGRVFRLYNSEDSLRRALEALPRVGDHAPALWRPFTRTASPGAGPAADAAQGTETADLLIPVLPWALSPLVLAADKSLEACFPAGDLIAPALIAAAARAVYDLIAADKEQGKGASGKAGAASRGNPPFRRIQKALALPGCVWRRQGIYLSYAADLDVEGIRRGPVDSWARLWKRFLEAGFLLPPDPRDPLILPGVMSPGEEAKLAGLLNEAVQPYPRKSTLPPVPSPE